jgi:hypothetical protein
MADPFAPLGQAIQQYGQSQLGLAQLAQQGRQQGMQEQVQQAQLAGLAQTQQTAQQEAARKQVEFAGLLAKGIQSLPEEQRPIAYQQARQQYEGIYGQDPNTPPEYDPTHVGQLAGYYDQLHPAKTEIKEGAGGFFRVGETGAAEKIPGIEPKKAAGKETFAEPYVDPKTGALLQKSSTGKITKIASPPKGMRIQTNPDGSFSITQGVDVTKRQLSPQQAKQLSAGAQLTFVLDPLDSLIEEQGDMFGPVEGRLRSANPYDTEAQAADAGLRRAAQTIGSYMEGGVLRKEDEIKYRKMLPQLTDTVAVAKKKLDGVRKLLAKKANKLKKDYGAAGFDVSGFENLSVGENEQTKQPQAGEVPGVAEFEFLGFE